MIMKTMRFGITYQHPKDNDTDPLRGVRSAVMFSYGVPMLFDDYEDALQYARKSFGFSKTDKKLGGIYSVKISGERECQSLVEKIVEFYSGRRALKEHMYSSELVVEDESKKKYSEMLEYIDNERRSHEIHRIKSRKIHNRSKGGFSFKMKKGTA